MVNSGAGRERRLGTWLQVAGLAVAVISVIVPVVRARDDVGSSATTPSSPPSDTSVASAPGTPPLPISAEKAGDVFGAPDSVAHYQKVGEFGWVTRLNVRLKLYPGLCVDFDADADPRHVLTGETGWIDGNNQMHRALMNSEGSIIGGATVYWSTCNRLPTS